MSAAAFAETSYIEHRDYVLAVLRRRCGWLADDEREAIFHDAYAVLLEKERDGELAPEVMHARQVRAYLTQTAINKALDEGKRAERNRSSPLGEAALTTPDPAGLPEELAAARLEGARVREIVEELPARRQTVVKLRFFFDRTPGEIQALLGITERVYRRELERALRHIAERYELVEEGRFCDSRRSLLLAFVAGVAGPNRAREARAHLETCPGCARWAAELREAARSAAAVAPPPVLASSGDGPLARASELAFAVKNQLAEVATGLKQHAVGVATRVDASAPVYAGGLRPGTVAAAIAGCVAIGGGATYCAVDGVPQPVSSFLGAESSARAESARPSRRERTRPARPPAAATPVAAPSPSPSPAASHRAPRRRSSTSSRRGSRPRAASSPSPSLAAAEHEFGLAGPDPGTTGSPASNPQRPASSAPATAGGGAGPPGEFDP